jgi:surface antigen
MPTNVEVAALAAMPASLSETATPSRLQEFVHRCKVVIGRGALALSLAAGFVVAETAAENPSAAMADTGGYADASAPCVANNDGTTEGAGYWCSGYQWGYYVRNSSGQIVGNVQNSSRGFGYRNCTDWAAFRAQQLTGILVPYGTAMGDAKDWNEKGAVAGYTVDDTPEPGDIAVWEATSTNSFGHLAVVESVNDDGTVTVSEYNRNYDGKYDIRTIAANNPADYVDLNGTGKGINGDLIAGGPSGSTTLARPAAANFNGALNVFTRGGDGQIYTQYWNGTSWTGFSSIGGNMASDPAAIVNGAALNVFARGQDGHIYTKYNDGSGWTGWSSLGTTTMKGSPRVIHYGTELDVFALGSDNHPYKVTKQDGSTWGGWSSLQNYMDSSPAPVQYGSELDVVMRGGDSQVYKDTWNGSSWGGFRVIGGCCLSGNPDVLQYGSQLDVWSNAPNNHIYKLTWNGTSWSGWVEMGSGFAGDPDVLQYGADLNVFARGTDGQIYTRYWSAANQTWSGWASTDTNKAVAGDPTVVQSGTELDIFVTGTDGKTYKNTKQQGANWGGFTPLPG